MNQSSVQCWDGKLRFAVLPLSNVALGQFSRVFCNVNRFRSLCWDGMLRVAILSLSKPGGEQFGLFFYDVNNSSV